MSYFSLLDTSCCATPYFLKLSKSPYHLLLICSYSEMESGNYFCNSFYRALTVTLSTSSSWPEFETSMLLRLTTHSFARHVANFALLLRFVPISTLSHYLQVLAINNSKNYTRWTCRWGIAHICIAIITWYQQPGNAAIMERNWIVFLISTLLQSPQFRSCQLSMIFLQMQYIRTQETYHNSKAYAQGQIVLSVLLGRGLV